MRKSVYSLTTNKMKKAKKNKTWSLYVIILLIATIIVSTLISMSLLAGVIPPSRMPFIAFVGIGFSYYVIAEVILFILYLLRLHKFALIPLFFIIISIPCILRVYTRHKPVDDSDAIEIVSYNVKYFSNSNGFFGNDSISDGILKALSQYDADIINIQEFYFGQQNPEIFVEKIKEYTGTTHYSFTRYYAGLNMAIATFSKYPIINIESIRADEKSFAICSDMVIGEDTLRIINAHLRSLHINKELNSISDGYDNAKIATKRIYGKAVAAFKLRELQSKRLYEVIRNSPYKLVLCGDFNDTPNSFAYKRIGLLLNDMFVKAGNGFGFTFKDLPLIRIDYMFCSKDLSPVYFSIDSEKKLSDHHAIIGKIKLSE